MHLNFNLSKKIIGWYDNNKRVLPWRVPFRSSKKLYYRLLSEFMLQQTQVKTVIPYFLRFVNKIKTLERLSQTNEKQILKYWEGLGYYRRARNLLVTSKILVKEKNSILPKTLIDIKKLPGVGDYTGNALLGLVYNQPRIALDGNVKRIFSRLINKRENKINFENFVKKNKSKLFVSGRNADFVEAVMEFGSLVCKPQNPYCNICTLRNFCKFKKSNKKNKLTTPVNFNKKNYNIFCYINKNKQIGLTNKNNLGFLKNFNLPIVKEKKDSLKIKNWNFLCNYKNSISNKTLNIDLYYKFSHKIPKGLNWYSLYDKKEFIPTFNKKIFRRLENLY